MTNPKILFLILLAAVFFFAGGVGLVSAETTTPSNSSPAATLTVGDAFGCGYIDLQSAVNDANEGDTILVQAKTFLGADSTVNIVDKSVTIIGGNVDCLGGGILYTVMQATFQVDTIFELSGATAPRSVELRNFELRDAVGDGLGGGIEIGANFSVALNNVSIHGNSADSGGGVRIIGTPGQTANTQVTLDQSFVYDNAVTGHGGGVYCKDATVTLSNGTVVGQENDANMAAIDGGGLYLDTCWLNQLSLADIAHNEARNGGGVYATDNSVVTLNHAASDISNNLATLRGGGLYLDNESTLIALLGHVDENRADQGGGIAAFDDSVIVFNAISGCGSARCLTLSANEAGNNFGDVGGGIYAVNSTASIRRAFVDFNYAYDGAAVHVQTDADFGAAASLLKLDTVLVGRNVARNRSIIELQNDDGDDHMFSAIGTTFAYNKTEFQQGDVLDIKLDGLVDATMTGIVVRGDESEDAIDLDAAVNTAVTCSVLPFGWPFSNVDNMIGRQEIYFRDVATNDFRLMPKSPAVDICATSTGARDITGVSRAVDLPSDLGNQTISTGAYDAGAYEFGGLFGLNGQPCAYATASDAIAAADAGDTVYGLPRVYDSTIGVINKDLSIQPSNVDGCDSNSTAANRLTFDGLNDGVNARIVNITGFARVTMTQVTLQNGTSDGSSGGNIQLTGRSLYLDNCIVRYGIADTVGGGIELSKASLVLHNSSVTANRSFGTAAGIYADLSTVTLTGDSMIGGPGISDGNVADFSGGGIVLRDSDLILRDNARVVGNESVNSSGGGVYATGASQITISDTAAVVDNLAGSNGGGVFLGDDNSTLTMLGQAAVRDNGAGNGGGVYVQQGASVMLDGAVSVVGNSAETSGGGIYASASDVQIQNGAIISSNSAMTGGGVNVIGVNGQLVLADSQVTSNSALDSGGGIRVILGSTGTISGSSIISGNVAAGMMNNSGQGGGIEVFGADTTVTMSDASQVIHNRGYAGGGLNVRQSAVLTVTDSAEISHNHGNSGGGIFIRSGGAVSMIGSTQARPRLFNNVAQGWGGGIRGSDAGNVVTLLATDVISNAATSGGGVNIERGRLEAVNTTFAQNRASGSGGAVYLQSATADISAEFSLNQRNAPACKQNIVPLDHYCSELHDNEAERGAAVSALDSTLRLTNTAITNNTGESIVLATAEGSDVTLNTVLLYGNGTFERVLFVDDGAEATLLNSTIYSNGGAPIETITAGQVTVERSILWSNAAGSKIDANTAFLSSCNIAQAEQAGSQPFNGPSDSAADPLLYLPATGGVYPLPNSPAIDACGGGAPLDLHGMARPLDGDAAASATEYDMGAFEFNPDAVPTAVALRDQASVQAPTPHGVMLSSFTLLLAGMTAVSVVRMRRAKSQS